jgi:glucose-1-phosphate thymidylyltransferase
MKTIVACGGSGTRMAPCNRFVNKHLIPVAPGTLMVDLPLQYLADQGVKEVSVVTGSNHASQICEYIADGQKYGFQSVSYSFQPKPAGISDVLNRVDILDRSVLLILGDNAFQGHKLDLEKLQSRDNAACFEYDVGSVELAGRFGQLYGDKIVEKTSQPLHSKILTGLYYFPKDVFTKLSKLTPSARNELEITDLLGIYLAEGRLDSYQVEGAWSDLGEWNSWQEFVEKYGRSFIR